jgi:hypothetical protein
MKTSHFSYRLLVVFFGLLTTFETQSQTFYNINTIQVVELYFSQPNWDYMMDTAKAGSGSYILADSVVINGTTIDSVGVRYKGNSSYSASRTKNPLHIELDHFKEDNAHEYDGITDIKLNNGFKDPTFIRETVSYTIARTYMEAPRANYARLYINGTYIGLYTNVESITKKFVASRFFSNQNPFFKCNPVYSTGNTSNLAYQGSDSSSYYNSYEIKSDGGWGDLVNLCNTLNNNISVINDFLDIDRVLWMHAFNNLLVNLDSYAGALSQNYYLYLADNGSFIPVVWDLNESFGCFNSTGVGPPLSMTQMQQLSPWLHMTNTARPLIKKLLEKPLYARMYMAHYRTIYNEFIVNNEYLSLGNSFQAIVDSSVQADVNKFYTYADFLNNMTQNVTSGPMTIPGVTLLMNGRVSYLSSQTDMLYSQPVISNVEPSDSMPDINDNIFITCDIQNGSAVMLGYRYDRKDRFVRIDMYDDGTHGDGSAGDGKWGVQIPVSGGLIQYYIYSENANAGKFSPERAEYEYYELYAVSGNIVAGDIVINELMAINSYTIADPNGQFDDWIELYNNTSNYVSLKDVYLSDSYSNMYKWKFPDNAMIEPNGYLIIWADEDTLQSGYHANFKLSGSGEDLVLSYNTGYYIDDLTFGAQTADISYGRYPNGTGGFTQLTPTPNAFNQPLSVEDISGSDMFSVTPNPAFNELFIQSLSAMIESVKIVTLDGKTIYDNSMSGISDLMIDVRHFQKGIYMIIINNNYTFKLVKQ